MGFHLLSSEDKNIDLATTAHQGTNETQIILALSFCIQRRITQSMVRSTVWNSRESRLHLTLAGLVTRYQKVQSTGKIQTLLQPRFVEALFAVNRLTFTCRSKHGQEANKPSVGDDMQNLAAQEGDSFHTFQLTLSGTFGRCHCPFVSFLSLGIVFL